MATHHVRQTSHPSKRTSVHVKSTKSTTVQKRSGSLGRKGSHKSTTSHKEVIEDEDEDPMAVSFLNYCTVCEKQIVVPSNTVLYCSESCKKKDSEKSLTDSYDYYSPPTTPFANFTFDDAHFNDIIPQRSPTQPHSKRNSYASSDGSFDDTPSGDEYTRSSSDASHYLRQCQISSYFNDTVRPVRPRYTRASTSHINFSAAPSLSHTPASSYSFSLPYTPATRPLPPRTNPQGPSKSIDLVTPLTSSSPKAYSCKAPPILRTSTAAIEGEILYAKSPVPSLSPANGSLGRLLASSPR
jgi:hypothetical protein